MKYPGVSVVICTYNGKLLVGRLLESIRQQRYPGKVEIICVDGGSGDGTLELLQKYRVRVHHNTKRFPEGKGMGKAQGVRLARNELVLIVDQDNMLVGKGCLKAMVEPLLHDKEIFGVACRLFVDKQDNLTNRYLSYVGTDPFAAYRSIEGKLALGKIRLQDAGSYQNYTIQQQDNLCTGGNCFLYRKKDLDEIGGYTQDVDVIAALVRKGRKKIAIPKEARAHHFAVSGFGDFLRKKWKWGWHYAFENRGNRNVSWYPRGFREYLWMMGYIGGNLIVLPNLFIGVKQAVHYRDAAWLLHPVAMFCNTFIYCCIGFLGLFKKRTRR